LLIALGAAGHHLAVSERTAGLFVQTMVGSAYILCVGLVVTATTGMRGLEPTGTALNVALHVANVIGVLGALFAGALLVRGAAVALRRESRPVASAASVVGAR
jgi:hypothetical protein